MAGPHRIQDLEVIGYATVLKDTMLPSPVAPLFRLRSDAAGILFPPYHLDGDFIWNATEGSQQELRKLAQDQEVTFFPDSFPAQPRHDLWIDSQWQAHYEPRGKAQETLRTMARENIQNARQAFASGNLAEADRFCGAALSADDRFVEALAIKAAIRRKRGDDAGERVMFKLASRAMTPEAFKQLVERCLETQSQRNALNTIAESPNLIRAINRPLEGMALLAT